MLGTLSVPEPVMLNVPLPEDVLPEPVPLAVTLRDPVVPAKFPVPVVKAMVAGPLDGTPAKTCASSDKEPVNVPVSVPVVPLVIVNVTGTEPANAAEARVKFELNVPLPMFVRLTVPLAEMLLFELVPDPVTIKVVLTVPAWTAAQKSAAASSPLSDRLSKLGLPQNAELRIRARSLVLADMLLANANVARASLSRGCPSMNASSCVSPELAPGSSPT
jgi:hypothetical protein